MSCNAKQIGTPSIIKFPKGLKPNEIDEPIMAIDWMPTFASITNSKLSKNQDDINFYGHSIECRVNAEDPDSFMPSPGKVINFHAPGGPGVRVDSGCYSGITIPPYYDSMIAKLIVYGENRESCIARLERALEEFVVEGIKTTIPFYQKILKEESFLNGNYDIHWVENYMENI